MLLVFLFVLSIKKIDKRSVYGVISKGYKRIVGSINLLLRRNLLGESVLLAILREHWLL